MIFSSIIENLLLKMHKIIHLLNATIGVSVNNVENKEDDREADPANPVQIYWIKPTQNPHSSSFPILRFHLPVFYPCSDEGDTDRLHEDGKDGEEAHIEVNINSCKVGNPW